MSGEIVVPSVGESINEVVVSRWLVEVGAYVAVDTPVVSLETDKATVEVPAPIQGYLRAIEKGEDDVAEVGTVLGLIEAGDPPADAPTDSAASNEATETASSDAAVVMPSAQRVLDQAQCQEKVQHRSAVLQLQMALSLVLALTLKL